MKFIFDNNLSPAYPAMLQCLSVDAKHIREVFKTGSIPDDVWMPDAARDGWIAVSQDRNIERRPHEAKARRDSGLRMFYLPSAFAKMGKWDQALFVVRQWPSIEAAARSMVDGQGFLVQQRGRLRPV